MKYNSVYKYLSETISSIKNNMTFRRLILLTRLLLTQLVNQINSSFSKSLFKLGVFIDLSKIFDTLDYEILISKLKKLGSEEKTFSSLETISLIGSNSLKVHKCRFENLPICLNLCKNSTQKISHF